MSLTKLVFGSTMKAVSAERFKASMGVNYFFNVLSRSVQAAPLHYMPGVGHIYCFQGQCCQDLGLPSIKYIVPVLEYSVQGSLTSMEYGTPVFVKYLSLSLKGYEEFMVKDQLNSDLTQKDMLVRCTNEQYQNLAFDIITGPCKWRQDKVLIEEVKKLYADFGALLELSVARAVTTQKYLELKAMALQNQPSTASAPAPAVPAAAPALPLPANLPGSLAEGLELADPLVCQEGVKPDESPALTLPNTAGTPATVESGENDKTGELDSSVEIEDLLGD